MQLKLTRTNSTQEYTEGKLYIDGVYFCDTLEDTDRELYQITDEWIIKSIKVYGKTCIPYGTYKVILSISNRFKKLMPEVLNVKGFTGIRIHSGNTHQDTSGCILVGTKSGDGIITKSRKTFNQLMNILRGNSDITLSIE